MKTTLTAVALLTALPVFAEDSRQLDAHEHGVGALNIAIDGTSVAMEFHAPGADIVGFEYSAKSDADLAAIETAIAALNAPLDLFVLPAGAMCTVTNASAELESEEAHDDHSDHKHVEDKHDDHADEGHKDHDDHDHDAHKETGHDDDDHDAHAKKAAHTEFHAEYMLNCDGPDALNEISFAYFQTFPNATEVEVQLISSSGAQSFEATRDAPFLDLGR